MVKTVKAPLDSGRWTTVGTLVRSIMPSHTVYCEPWFLEGEVFFQKPPVGVEIINDPANRVITFYLQVLNRPEQLNFMIESTLQSDTLRNLASDIIEGRTPADAVGQAWAVWLMYNVKYINRQAWLTEMTEHIQTVGLTRQGGFTLDKAVADRLKGVHIWARDAEDVIRQADSPDTFFYMHPNDYRQLKKVGPLLLQMRGKIALYCSTSRMTDWVRKSGVFTPYTDDRGTVVWLNFNVTRTLF